MRKRKQEDALEALDLTLKTVDKIKDSGAKYKFDMYFNYSWFKYESLVVIIFKSAKIPRKIRIEFNGKKVLVYECGWGKVKYYYPGFWIEEIKNLYDELEKLENEKNIDEEIPSDVDEETRHIIDESAEQVLKRFREYRHI